MKMKVDAQPAASQNPVPGPRPSLGELWKLFQEQQARSILEMNRIAVLDTVLPQKDGFISLYATGRTGREAGQPKLRSVALAMDEALLAFIDAACREAAQDMAASA